MTCPLCKKEKLTHWYYEGPEFWIADCITCNIPMLVWNEHVKDTPKEKKEELVKFVKKHFGDQVKIRWRMNKIKDHFHFHIENVPEDKLHKLVIKDLQLRPEDVEVITEKVFPKVSTGLYLVEPHGQYIYEGKKKLIVKSKKFKDHIREDLLLVSGPIAYGIINLQEPFEIKTLEEFNELKDDHLITKEEYKKWNWSLPLYGYKFSFKKFTKPIPVKVPKGVQVFFQVKDLKTIKQLDLKDLIYLHAYVHSLNKEYEDIWCKLHYEIALEMLHRGLYHSGDTICDRVVELIKDWRTYDPSKVRDEVLRDDWRIVHAWMKRVCREGKRFTSPQFKDLTLEEQKKVIMDLREKIRKEMMKRGWRPKEELIELPKGFEVSDIDIKFVNKLSNEELEDLWKWLHDKWRKEYPDRNTPEDYVNANIFIQIERWKRGLIDIDYVDKDELDKASRYAWQEYGSPSQPLEDYISLEEVIKAIRETGIIPVKGQPYGAYLVGRIVNEGKIPKDHDIDIVFRQRPDPRLIIALKQNLPEWISKRLHVVFDPSGPGIGYSVPVYGYSLNPLPSSLMKKGFGPFRLDELKVGRRIIGVKPKSGILKYEFFTTKDSWEKWGSKHIQNGIFVEEKVDGRRVQIHIDQNNNVKLLTEDTGRDVSYTFKNIVNELKDLNIPNSILDGEITLWTIEKIEGKNARSKREISKLIPREDWAFPGKYDEFLDKHSILVIYDIMKLKGKDLVDLPYQTRRQEYTKIIPKTCKYIDYTRGELVRNMGQYFKIVNKYRGVSGSEGVVMKDIQFKYPVKYSGESRTEDMSKIKNLKEIDVIVLGIKQKKTKEGRPLPSYMYESYVWIPDKEVPNWAPEEIKEYKGKKYLKIGMSYSTNVKANIGDIITVMPIEISVEERKGKKYLTWMFPWFKEKRTDKDRPDPLDVALKIAKLGTKPLPEHLTELDQYIRVDLVKCPYFNDPSICPLLKRFGIRRAYLNLAYVEEEVLKYPIMCPLSRIFKCPYVKPYYYGYVGYYYDPELSDDLPINEWSLPKRLFVSLQGKYLECPPGEHEFVMQSHILTSKFVPKEKKIPEQGSQHLDWRMSVDGYLIGWSIVGGNVKNQITPKRLMENIAKGFRTETKARQPKVWLFKEKPVSKKEEWSPGEEEPAMYDVLVGKGEPRGKMFVFTRGKVIFGVQKVYFHEYFLKDNRYFKDWTRIVVRAIKGPRLDPRTKEPVKGTTEMFWRTMIPKDQKPYALSKRAIEKKYKPPSNNKYPFPKEWAKKNWPKEFERYEEYLKGLKLELSNIKYTLSMHSWKGPLHVRGIPRRSWYLFLDDKGSGSVRTFRLEDVPPFAEKILAWNEGRDNRKYLDWEGKTRPMSRFNPNKELKGEMKILEKGSVSYSSVTEDKIEIILLDFGKGKIFSGKWTLIQEDPDSDAYVLSKTKKLSRSFPFVYHKHCIRRKDNCHYDIRIKKDNYLDEFNLYDNIIEKKEVKAHRKTCSDIKDWFIKEGKEVFRKVGYLPTWVTVLDTGIVEIIEDNPDFISMKIEGKKIKGFWVAKKEGRGYKNWIFKKEKGPIGLSTGNPKSGEYYKPFRIEEKKTWDHFDVYLYDPKEFTRSEPSSKAKKYLDIEIPSGVLIYIGLYPIPGKIHHARVMMVRFKKDKWSKEEAINWIKSKDLHKWNGVMIRE